MNSIALPFSILVLLAGCGVPDAGELPTNIPKKASDRIFYAVTKVEGTYGGKAEKRMAATWTDTLAHVTCTYDSTGTNANQNPFLGDPSHDAWSSAIAVGGLAKCPAAYATSTSTKPCSSKPLELTDKNFQWDIEIAGWDDASIVTFKAASAPSGQPSCNFASVLSGWGHTTSLDAATTVGMFRAGVPFPVRFVGERTLTFDGNTSQVEWDLTVTIAPKN